jgi:hypothetical protein
MTRAKPSKPVLLAIGAVHLGITTVTWRDLARRPPDQIRGPKPLWRVISAANTAGSIAYWILGRKSSA